jgi:hypothetical protein
MSAAAPQDIESAAIRQRVAQPGDGPCAHKIGLVKVDVDNQLPFGRMSGLFAVVSSASTNARR